MVLAYLSILVLLYLLGWPYWKKAYALRRWRNALNLRQHHAIFQETYNNIDGFALSHRARIHQDAMEYTYGEIEFMSFIALISMTHPTPDTRFYDLGSGIGKAVLACAMVFDMQHCCGIELFNELHQAALIQQSALQQLPTYQYKASTIQFIHDDFLNTDLSRATLIFINATALFGVTWERLNQRLAHDVAIGTIIITTSKPLIASSAFIVVKTTRVDMSWGVVTAYIHSSV